MIVRLECIIKPFFSIQDKWCPLPHSKRTCTSQSPEERWWFLFWHLLLSPISADRDQTFFWSDSVSAYSLSRNGNWMRWVPASATDTNVRSELFRLFYYSDNFEEVLYLSAPPRENIGIIISGRQAYEGYRALYTGSTTLTDMTALTGLPLDHEYYQARDLRKMIKKYCQFCTRGIESKPGEQYNTGGYRKDNK